MNDLVYLWWDILELSNTSNFQESKFYIYLVLFNEWVKSNESLIPSSTADVIKSARKAFKAQLRLTSGYSMEILWDRMRPTVPSSLDGWDSYTKLQILAARFDAVVPQFNGK